MIKFDFGAILQGQYLQWLITGAVNTLTLFVVALACAFIIAVLLVVVRSLPFWPLEWAVAAYVNYHRNVPTLVQIFVWYFGVPQLLPASVSDWINNHNGEFVFALIALSLNAAAYISEDLRSGLRSIAKDQMEAARALGLSYGQAMRDVLLPQAIRVAVPALINQSLNLFKTTSLAMAIGVAEMTYSSRQIENETYRTFETFALASAFYLVVSFAIMLLGTWYNRRHLPMKAR
jgi:polar amino acid transport system permease protein